MRHKENARVRESKVTQAAAAIALQDTEGTVNDAEAQGMGGRTYQ